MGVKDLVHKNLFQLVGILTLALLITEVTCKQDNDCDKKCVKKCADDGDTVCGANGKLYTDTCVMLCCGQTEVEMRFCKESGDPNNPDDVTEIPIGKKKDKKTKKQKKKKKKAKKNRITCDMECYDNCSGEDEIICGENGKLFDSLCKMDCCGISKADTKVCAEKGSKKAKIAKPKPTKNPKDPKQQDDDGENKKDEEHSKKKKKDKKSSKKHKDSNKKMSKDSSPAPTEVTTGEP